MYQHEFENVTDYLHQVETMTTKAINGYDPEHDLQPATAADVIIICKALADLAKAIEIIALDLKEVSNDGY